MYYDNLSRRKEELLVKKEELQNLLKNMPQGNLYCSKNGKYYRWDLYYDRNHKEVIPKKNPWFAENMALKRYFSCQLNDVEKELKAVDGYLKNYQKTQEAEELLLHPEFYRLLKGHFKPMGEELELWRNAPYEKNDKHPENLIHETLPGVFVRSKSEALIYIILHKNNIPFRYEEKLRLGNKIIYPDFTIRHPNTGITYYWEHFGMMDDPSYCRSACSKIQLYAAHGIIPSVQLITTYETLDYPLTMAKIEKIVKDNFL